MSVRLTLSGLNAFLVDAKAHAMSKPSFLSACLGNESCDLDSATSALIRAYALSSTTTATTANTRKIVVPVLNCSVDDFGLRTEIVHHFASVGVDAGQLLFEDSINLDDYARREALELYLVDHNRLAMKQARWEPCVVDVVDHHKDEGGCPNASKSKRIAFPMGSCASLVAEHVLNVMGASLDPLLARLLLGVILVDTGNLDPALGKTEPLDKAMSIALAECASLDTASQTALWTKINEAKFDVTLLSTLDMLRKDYKEFAMGGFHVGISAVLESLPRLDERGDLLSSAQAWMTKRTLQILLIMAAYYEADKTTFRRQLLICYPAEHAGVGDALTQSLAGQSLLQLAPLVPPLSSLQPGLVFRAFSQGNITASRKQVQPMTESFFAANKL